MDEGTVPMSCDSLPTVTTALSYPTPTSHLQNCLYPCVQILKQSQTHTHTPYICTYMVCVCLYVTIHIYIYKYIHIYSEEKYFYKFYKN